MTGVLKVFSTGAARQIAYNLRYMGANGNMFIKDQKIILHLLYIPVTLTVFSGFVMELEDCKLCV